MHPTEGYREHIHRKAIRMGTRSTRLLSCISQGTRCTSAPSRFWMATDCSGVSSMRPSRGVSKVTPSSVISAMCSSDTICAGDWNWWRNTSTQTGGRVSEQEHRGSALLAQCLPCAPAAGRTDHHLVWCSRWRQRTGSCGEQEESSPECMGLVAKSQQTTNPS